MPLSIPGSMLHTDGLLNELCRSPRTAGARFFITRRGCVASAEFLVIPYAAIVVQFAFHAKVHSHLNWKLLAYV